MIIIVRSCHDESMQFSFAQKKVAESDLWPGLHELSQVCDLIAEPGFRGLNVPPLIAIM